MKKKLIDIFYSRRGSIPTIWVATGTMELGCQLSSLIGSLLDLSSFNQLAFNFTTAWLTFYGPYYYIRPKVLRWLSLSVNDEEIIECSYKISESLAKASFFLVNESLYILMYGGFDYHFMAKGVNANLATLYAHLIVVIFYTLTDPFIEYFACAFLPRKCDELIASGSAQSKLVTLQESIRNIFFRDDDNFISQIISRFILWLQRKHKS